jgi:small subunit ribosomal protein S16
MLAIKLQRVGRKHQPSYRLVVAERRTKMAAPPVEDLGSYQPGTKATAFKKDRVAYWLGVGAQPTVTAHNLLVAQGVISGAKHAVKMAKPEAKEVVAEKPVEVAAVAAEEPVEAKTTEVAPTEVTPTETETSAA